MSGSKRVTVTIREEEYQRLREAEHLLRTMPKPKSEAQVALEQRSLAKIQGSLQESQQRQATFQEILLGTNRTIQQIEENTSRALLEFQADTAAEMETFAGDLSRYVDRRLNDQRRRFETAIANNHRAYQKELRQLTQEMRRQATDQQRKQALALEWLQAGQGLSFYLRENYGCDFFFPGEVDRLEQTLAQAQQNLEMGMTEAAIAPAQQAYMALSDLRVQLEQCQQEYELLLQAVEEAVGQLKLRAEESKVVQARDLDGNELPYTVDVDFWSEQRWRDVRDDLEQIESRLHDPAHSPDRTILDRWLLMDLPAIEQALEDVVVDARVAALNSQLRVNIADLVVRALQEQGFHATDATYEAGDQRACYHVKLSSIDGGEVAVEVSPAGMAIGENQLQIDSYDREERTEHELMQRWLEISRSLQGYGVQVGPYERLDQRRELPIPARVAAPAGKQQARRSR